MELDELKIYAQYVELMYYTNLILKKYPKSERYALVNDIKDATNLGMEYIITAHRELDKKKRIEILNGLDVKLKFIKVLIRISYKNKYISAGNYGAWSKKLTNIGNLLGGWIKSCLKQ